MIIRISIIGFFLLLLMNSIHYYKSDSKTINYFTTFLLQL